MGFCVVNCSNLLALDEPKSDVALQGEFRLVSIAAVHIIGSAHQLAPGL